MSKKGNKKRKKRIKGKKRRLSSSDRRTPVYYNNHQAGFTGSTQGFDYGILPSLCITANPNFYELYYKAKCLAVSYTVIPQVGMRSDIPMIGLAFENYKIARQWFMMIKDMMTSPCDESALDMSFVEDLEDNRYFFHVGINIQQLFLRTLGKGGEKDFRPMGITTTLSKDFKISKYFLDFKNNFKGEDILVCPMKLEKNVAKKTGGYDSFKFAFNPDNVEYDVGFWKKDIEFNDVVSMDQDSTAYISSKIASGEKPEKKNLPALDVPSADEVRNLRIKQMRRFFPVILARIEYNNSYRTAEEFLVKSYLEWQVLQAACNILIKNNSQDRKNNSQIDMFDIYNQLRNSAQDANEDWFLNFDFEIEELEKQILLDVKYLHSEVCKGSKLDPKKELISGGYL